ncbi:MAG: hypothetical protein JEY94_07600 [Melioribacteraceae bacterium]|nr:hypothetical protein [Melioribacteraceae bacterium]
MIILLVVLCYSCERSLLPPIEENSKIIYKNSFENISDINNWAGITEFDIFNSTCKNCGSHSIRIGGGCVLPHALYAIKETCSAGYYYVDCWNKLILNGGEVRIYLKDKNNYYPGEVSIPITDTTWNYKKSDLLYMPENSTLYIEMNSGGIIAGGMLIDELRVVKVKSESLYD